MADPLVVPDDPKNQYAMKNAPDFSATMPPPTDQTSAPATTQDQTAPGQPVPMPPKWSEVTAAPWFSQKSPEGQLDTFDKWHADALAHATQQPEWKDPIQRKVDTDFFDNTRASLAAKVPTENDWDWGQGAATVFSHGVTQAIQGLSQISANALTDPATLSKEGGVPAPVGKFLLSVMPDAIRTQGKQFFQDAADAWGDVSKKMTPSPEVSSTAGGKAAALIGNLAAPLINFPAFMVEHHLQTYAENYDQTKDPTQAANAAQRATLGDGLWMGVGHGISAGLKAVLPEGMPALQAWATKASAAMAGNISMSHLLTAAEAAANAPAGQKEQAFADAFNKQDIPSDAIQAAFGIISAGGGKVPLVRAAEHPSVMAARDHANALMDAARDARINASPKTAEALEGAAVDHVKAAQAQAPPPEVRAELHPETLQPVTPAPEAKEPVLPEAVAKAPTTPAAETPPQVKPVTLTERPVTEAEKTGEMYGDSNWTHVVDVSADGKTVGKIRGNVTNQGFEVKGANIDKSVRGQGLYQQTLRQLADKYGSTTSDTDMQPSAEAAWKKVGATQNPDGSYTLEKPTTAPEPAPAPVGDAKPEVKLLAPNEGIPITPHKDIPNIPEDSRVTGPVIVDPKTGEVLDHGVIGDDHAGLKTRTMTANIDNVKKVMAVMNAEHKFGVIGPDGKPILDANGHEVTLTREEAQKLLGADRPVQSDMLPGLAHALEPAAPKSLAAVLNEKDATELGLKGTKDPIRSALNAIISKPSSPPRFKLLANHILAALGDTTSNIQVNLVADDSKNAGSYFPHPTDPTKGEITVNMTGGHKGGVTQTVLHELVHHVVLRKLDPGYKLTPEEAVAVDRLQKIYDHIKSETKEPDAYHLSDLDEFITHLLTDPDVQADLHTQDLPAKLKQPGQKSILDGLFAALRRLFGAYKQDGVLEAALKEAGILTSTLPEAGRMDFKQTRRYQRDLSLAPPYVEPTAQKTPTQPEPGSQPEPATKAEPTDEKAAGKFTGVVRDGKIIDHQLELNPDASYEALAKLQTHITTLASEGKLTAADAARMAEQVIAARDKVSRLMFSNQNAKIDSDRKAQGLAPLASTAAQSYKGWWAEAEKQFTGDPEVINRLMKDLSDKPRGATPVESAMLLMKQIDLHHRIATASRGLDDAAPETRVEARAKFTALQEDYDHLQRILRTSGEENARGQVARKMMAAEDYSLAKMLTEKRAAAGDPKTPAEREAQETWVKKHNTEITKAQQAEEDHAASSDRVVKPTKTKESATSEQIAAKIHTKIFENGAPLNSLGNLIQRLARSFVAEGVTDREKLIDAVHSVLKQYDPELERTETMNAISGYGKWRPLSKDAVSKTLRDLTGQMQQLGKLETMREGEAPLKTGSEHRIPTIEEKVLTQLVRTKLRAGGFETTDDDFRLKSGLEQLKARLEKRITDYKDRLANKDFAPKTKPEPIAQDPEADRLQAATLKAKNDYKRGLLADQAAQRPLQDKALDMLAKFSRAAKLSAISTLFKLTGAAAYRAVQIPTEDLIGGGLGSVPGPLKTVFAKASIEGGFSVNAYAKGYAQALTTGMKDAYDMATTGHSTLSTLFGDKVVLPPSILDWFGQLHGALKSPALRGAYTIALEKQIGHAMRNGVDVTDPLVMTSLMMDTFKQSAAKYAYRQILLQDNVLSDWWKGGLARLEAKDKATGQIPLRRKVGATSMRATIPIVKVPLNYVTEALVHATGSVSGSVKLIGAMRRGMENLTPEESDVIARHLKKGLLGAAVLALGYFNSAPGFIQAGGYYTAGEKRKPGDVGAGRLRLGNWDVPSFLSHSPLLECLQLGATMRRVSDQYVSTTDRHKKGLPAGVMAGALGLARETPYMETMLDMSKLVKDPAGYAGDFARGIVVPQAVQNIAGWTDLKPEVQKNYIERWLKSQTIRRQPKGIVEHLKMGVPGLRQQVKKAKDQNP